MARNASSFKPFADSIHTSLGRRKDLGALLIRIMLAELWGIRLGAIA